MNNNALLVFMLTVAVCMASNSIQLSASDTAKIMNVYKDQPNTLHHLVQTGKILELFSISATEEAMQQGTVCGYAPSLKQIRVCPNGFYCQVDRDTCGGVNWVNNGTCMPIPSTCSNVTCNNATVLSAETGAACGCDGKWYCNTCVMNQARVSHSINSRCTTVIVDGSAFATTRPSMLILLAVAALTIVLFVFA